MRRRRQQIKRTDLDYCNLDVVPKTVEPGGIPFVDRLSCTIAEACEATGLGRTKLYELMGDGQIETYNDWPPPSCAGAITSLNAEEKALARRPFFLGPATPQKT
jgi:hypothetical protein